MDENQTEGQDNTHLKAPVTTRSSRPSTRKNIFNSKKKCKGVFGLTGLEMGSNYDDAASSNRMEVRSSLMTTDRNKFDKRSYLPSRV